MRYRALLVSAMTLALMGQGCLAPVKTPAPSPTPSPAAENPAGGTRPAGELVKPKTVTVEVKDNAFSPQVIAINPGDTVVWKNVGKMNHTSTGIGQPLLWDSGNIAPGQSYSRKFDSIGSYDYSCAIHPGMTGTVSVGELLPVE